MLSKFIIICSVLALWKTKLGNLFKRELPLHHEIVSPVTHRNSLFLENLSNSLQIPFLTLVNVQASK